MKTAQMEAEEKARRNFELHLEDHRCHCGGYKWPGFCFCFACQDRLPAQTRRNLYGKSGDAYRQAYAKARLMLTESEQTAIKETDHGTER